MTDITISISSDIRDNILEARPIPTDELTGQPLFTPMGWLKRIAVRHLNSLSKKGHRRRVTRDNPPATQIIED